MINNKVINDHIYKSIKGVYNSYMVGDRLK